MAYTRGAEIFVYLIIYIACETVMYQPITGSEAFDTRCIENRLLI